MLRLKSLRKFNRLSRKELGEMIGVSESTVAAFEQGLREPNPITALKMSVLFNTSIAHLYGADDVEEHLYIGELSDEEKAFIFIKRIQNNLHKRDMN